MADSLVGPQPLEHRFQLGDALLQRVDIAQHGQEKVQIAVAMLAGDRLILDLLGAVGAVHVGSESGRCGARVLIASR